MRYRSADVAEPAGYLDIASTIQQALGRKIPDAMQGESVPRALS
ncbi:MAG: hypothetical protein VW709_12725 [Rickettsiales bacterium]